MSLASRPDGMIGTRLTILPETIAPKRQRKVSIKQVSTAISGSLEGGTQTWVPRITPGGRLNWYPSLWCKLSFLLFLCDTLAHPHSLCTTIAVLPPVSWLLKRFTWGCLFAFLWVCRWHDPAGVTQSNPCVSKSSGDFLSGWQRH